MICYKSWELENKYALKWIQCDGNSWDVQTHYEDLPRVVAKAAIEKFEISSLSSIVK